MSKIFFRSELSVCRRSHLGEDRAAKRICISRNEFFTLLPYLDTFFFGTNISHLRRIDQIIKIFSVHFERESEKHLQSAIRKLRAVSVTKAGLSCEWVSHHLEEFFWGKKHVVSCLCVGDWAPKIEANFCSGKSGFFMTRKTELHWKTFLFGSGDREIPDCTHKRDLFLKAKWGANADFPTLSRKEISFFSHPPRNKNLRGKGRFGSIQELVKQTKKQPFGREMWLLPTFSLLPTERNRPKSYAAKWNRERPQSFYLATNFLSRLISTNLKILSEKKEEIFLLLIWVVDSTLSPEVNRSFFPLLTRLLKSQLCFEDWKIQPIRFQLPTFANTEHSLTGFLQQQQNSLKHPISVFISWGRREISACLTPPWVLKNIFERKKLWYHEVNHFSEQQRRSSRSKKWPLRSFFLWWLNDSANAYRQHKSLLFGIFIFGEGRALRWFWRFLRVTECRERRKKISGFFFFLWAPPVFFCTSISLLWSKTFVRKETTLQGLDYPRISVLSSTYIFFSVVSCVNLSRREDTRIYISYLADFLPQ